MSLFEKILTIERKNDMPQTITFTQKETSLLKDLTSQEKLCIEKYTQYASSAYDSNLKNLFNTLKSKEEQHLNTLTQIQQGQIPQVGTSSSSQSGSSQWSQSSSSQSSPSTSYTSSIQPSTCTPDQKQKDCYLCQDALSTEKHVSSLYNTSVFEFVNPQLRSVLNHIQKEEQEHGEAIFNYLKINNMYSPQ